MSLLANGLRVLAIGAVASLAVPASSAHAEGSLLPPISKLFAWDAQAERRAEAPASCAPGSAPSPEAQARRQAAMARLAAVMKAQQAGGGEVLTNRGYGYGSRPDPRREMMIVEMEARAAKRRAAN
jgi:hypothetical protein